MAADDKSSHMEVNALQLVLKSVLLGKMTYAVSAWSGYTTAADKQRLHPIIAHSFALSCENLTLCY